MKKVVYLFNALTLILLPFGALTGEPLKTKVVEPKAVSVAHGQLFQTPFERAIQLSYMAPRIIEPIKPVVQSVKQDDDETEKVEPTTTAVVKPLGVAKVNAEKAKETEPQGKVRTFTVTAYTAGAESTGKSKNNPEYGRTFSGDMVEEGVTVSCPKSLPIGTKLYIKDMERTYICQDRGSGITEGKLDIYIKDLQKALDFGRQKMEVVILDTM